MITKKHAYIILSDLKYTIRDIEDRLNENNPVSAWRVVQELKEKTDSIIKPMYSTLSKKDRKELLDGWMPDTAEGNYIKLPDIKFDNEVKK